MHKHIYLSTILIILIMGFGLLPLLHAPDSQAQTKLLLAVDASADQKQISPLIYGMNFPDEQLINQLGLTLQRRGGNATTRYNWQNDFYNTGSDWFFENIASENPARSTLPNGSAADRFVEQGRTTGIQSLMVVPLIGYVAKDSPIQHPFACGFKVSSYGPQQNVDPYDTDCGNGKQTNGSYITGNNPADTSIVVGPDFVKAWVTHLVQRYGRADAGGLRFYNLDNEPGLWPETHRDVYPQHVTYTALRDRGIAYAGAVKDADPSAQVLGPVQDGWTRYFYASYQSYPDTIAQAERDSYAGTPFVEWYLREMKAAEQQQGRRLLDYLDLHYYPQASGVALSPAGNDAQQALRLRSTRSLWDASYVDESWIAGTESGNTAVKLIPRMRAWVSQYYPATKLAVGEYNWGALDHINGALAQADVLGIFGREGLDLATLWEPPTLQQPGAFAFRMYRNYDGQGKAFGETSVRAQSSNQEQLSIYAARRVDGALTLMIINKTKGTLSAELALSGFTASAPAQVYRYSTANLQQIVKALDLPDTNLGNLSFPGESITLLVFSGLTQPPVELTPRLWLPSVVRE